MNSSTGHFRGLKLSSRRPSFGLPAMHGSGCVRPLRRREITWHGTIAMLIMDDATGAITPFKPGERGDELRNRREYQGRQAPRRRSRSQESSAGNPCHGEAAIGTTSSNRSRTPETRFSHRLRGARPGPTGKAWDLWYKFMTETHGLAKKSASSDEQGRSQ